jgi:hypothetical protein
MTLRVLWSHTFCHKQEVFFDHGVLVQLSNLQVRE